MPDGRNCCTPLDPLNDSELHNHVKQNLYVDDAEADRVIAVYRKGPPSISNIDVYLAISSDNWDRIDSITEVERKIVSGNAPVYGKMSNAWVSFARSDDDFRQRLQA